MTRMSRGCAYLHEYPYPLFRWRKYPFSTSQNKKWKYFQAPMFTLISFKWVKGAAMAEYPLPGFMLPSSSFLRSLGHISPLPSLSNLDVHNFIRWIFTTLISTATSLIELRFTCDKIKIILTEASGWNLWMG